MNTPNEVTVEQARDALSRFIHSHFRETGKDCARFSIPANRDRDDDMILSRFIDQYEALRAAPPKIDGVPKVPGWYWARRITTGKREPLRPVEVVVTRLGCNYCGEPPGGFEVQDPEEDMSMCCVAAYDDYHGPLTPPKETT